MLLAALDVSALVNHFVARFDAGVEWTQRDQSTAGVCLQNDAGFEPDQFAVAMIAHPLGRGVLSLNTE